MAQTTDGPTDLDQEAAGDRSLHARALDDYNAAYAREQENIQEGYEDLSFLAGNQWDDGIRKDREDQHRPCLTVNQLPQFCRQITGDIRQMRPSIKVVPVDSRGDPETAKVIAGMVRYIENRSMAPAVYYHGADGQVQAGRGAWRVTTEYASDTTFEQEIRIAPIEDGLSVLFDPDAIEPGRTDAMFAFVGVDLSTAAFKRRWPDSSPSAFGSDDGRLFQGWYGEDFVRVAEYWFKEPVERLLMIDGGKVIDLTDEPEEALQAAQARVQAAAQVGQAVRIEKRDGFKIRYATISGSEVLEGPFDWPGRYLPIVAVDGEEIRIGRKVVRHGAVRHARDPARMFNYYVSAQTEMVALQPKAPFIGTEKNFEEFEDEWETANTANRPYLRYTPDGANGQAAPQRQQPITTAPGISEGLQIAAKAIQSTTGIYNSSLGAASNETSGKAITARQREGDTGTYVYVERFGQALTMTGKIVVDLIPHVYDTTREMRIIGDDGAEEVVEINQPAGLTEATSPEAEAAADYANDVTVGAYDVVVEMGPSYNTRREEARDGMIAFLQASPQMAPVMLDLVAKMQDWPLADEVRERLEVLLPPPVKALIDAKKAGKDGQPPAPPQPSPQEQAAMAQQQREAEVQDREHQMKLADLDLGMQKIAAERAKVEAEMRKVEIEAQTRVQEAEHQSITALAGAEAARHAAAAPPAGPSEPSPASAAAPAHDPRVDHIAEAVSQLDQAVGQMAEMLQALMAGLAGPAAPPAMNDAGPLPPADFGALAGPEMGTGPVPEPPMMPGGAPEMPIAA